jgi:hypothetical protein
MDPFDDFDRFLESLSVEAVNRSRRQQIRKYRKYLGSTVGFASPILLDVLDAGELKLALESLSPSWSFPERLPTGAGWIRHWRRPDDLMRDRTLRYLGWCKGYFRTAEETFERLFVTDGTLVRSCEDQRGGLGIRIVGDHIETALRVRRAIVMTRRDLVRVSLPGSLPDTIVLAAPGRELGEIVGHDLFADRDYVVQTAVAHEALTIITATAPAVPFQMPQLGRIRLPTGRC